MPVQPGETAVAGLTNMPSVWGDLQLNEQPGTTANQDQLVEQENLARKKKIMAAGSTNQFLTATQLMFGSRTGVSGTVP